MLIASTDRDSDSLRICINSCHLALRSRMDIEEEVEWFDNLEKSELEWMVTSIKDRLGLE